MKKGRMKKIVVAILSLFLLFLIGTAGYIYVLLEQIQENPWAESSDPSSPSNTGKKPSREDLGISDDAPDSKETGVFNMLLFGLDSRAENQNSRSDVIMIATIDKKNEAIKLTSLMRDMYVSIPGKQDNRINTAYIFGGPALAIKTINTNFNLDIQYYATVDFFGLEKIIDQVGGVTIDVKKNEVKALNQILNELNNLNKKSKPSPLVTKSGSQTLNGRQAVAYARIRSVGHADFERTERQRTILSELFKKVKTVSPLKFPGLVTALLPHVETNLPVTEIVKLGVSVLGFKNKDIIQYRLPVDGTYQSRSIRGMAVLVPDLEKNKELLHNFLYGEGSESHSE
ncbi:MAG: LCP family protein [Clostridiales bacterium]|nr:LCP family protein [Clostridiales bacterium]